MSSTDSTHDPTRSSNGTKPHAATPPQLVVRWPNGEEFLTEVDRDNFIIGRAPDADLVVPQTAPYVSSRHLEIQHTPAGYGVVDLGSTNGTRLNNRRLQPTEAVALRNGDILRIGSERYGSSVSFVFRHETEAAAAPAGFQTHMGITSLTQIERITIGRDPSSDIVLDSPAVALHHAVIQIYNVRKYGDQHHLIRGVDGRRVVVNGMSVEGAHLQPGDTVQIGPYVLTYDGERLVQYASQGYRMDVVDLYKEVKTRQGPVRLLDQISFTILPREFVALVGGSGAGKSTLLDALNGFRPAAGQVLINGRDLYTHYDQFRKQIGYVPQQDILPATLTVEAALRYAAQLRLPADTSAAERDARIRSALETVEMEDVRIRNTRISRLSGGQRKRVSIAAELLADPKLFFLDEPASGLDPGLEKKLMYTLRKMADEGRTIIMITHATDNITQVDQVAFLAEGKLIYYGPPVAAPDYFDVLEFADIYGRIEGNGDRWRQIFTQEKPDAYQKNVLERQAAIPKGDSVRAPRAGQLARLRNGLHQLGVLSRRTLRLILSDPVALFVLLLVMPLVAVQQLLVSTPYELTGDPSILGDMAGAITRLTSNYLPALDAHTFLFGVAMLAFLVGAFGGSQELIKERSIYLRERMVNLGLLPYLASKYLVFGAFAGVQTALYVAVLSLGMELPVQGLLLPGPVEITMTLFLTVMAGTATGLFISSVSPNSTVAMYLVLIAVFFQNIFSGAVHDLRNQPIEPQSYVAATRWSTLALGTTVGVPELAAATIVCGNRLELNLPQLVEEFRAGTLDLTSFPLTETDEPACTNRAMDPADLLLPYGDKPADLLRFWGWLVALGALFCTGAVFAIKRLDWK